MPISNTGQRWLKRRNSVEPIIGHLKADGRMRRCYLKGVQGDALEFASMRLWSKRKETAQVALLGQNL